MWVYENDIDVLYFSSGHFEYNENIVITSFNNTLIKGDVKKETVEYLELYDKSIIPFFQKIHESNGSIIIIENMQNQPQYLLKQAAEKFIQLMQLESDTNIPFIIMFSLSYNRFKKPYTHIITKLEHLYQSKDGKKINLDNSILIGNNAGRIKTTTQPADNITDRAFANNIGIKNFLTPNHVFLNDMSPRSWKWHNHNINIKDVVLKHKVLIEPSFNDILNDQVSSNTNQTNQNITKVIFITGPPTSGKTLLGNRIRMYLNDTYQKEQIARDVIILDVNNFEHSKQLIKVLTAELEHQLTENPQKYSDIIVIDTNENIYKRSLYFDIFTNKNSQISKNIKKYKLKYIEIDIERNLCEYLNIFRLQISKSNTLKLIPKYIYNTYYNNYKKFSPKEIKDVSLLTILKIVNFPFVIRERKELYYYY
jgi:hypothetical protein